MFKIEKSTSKKPTWEAWAGLYLQRHSMAIVQKEEETDTE